MPHDDSTPGRTQADKGAVLVISVNEVRRELLAVILKRAGYSVLAVADLAGARQALSSDRPPSTVVIDFWKLNHSAVNELLLDVRLGALAGGTPIRSLVLSGLSDKDEQIATCSTGADAVLRWYLGSGEILQALRSLCPPERKSTESRTGDIHDQRRLP